MLQLALFAPALASAVPAAAKHAARLLTRLGVGQRARLGLIIVGPHLLGLRHRFSRRLVCLAFEPDVTEFVTEGV